MALEAAGGAVLSALLQVAFQQLASKEVIDFFMRKKLDLNLLKKLNTTMLSINNLIEDAEEKETIKPSVKEWLDQLKDAIYNAEDLLDVISTLDLTHKMKTKFHHFTSKLHSSWNPFDLPIHQEFHNSLDELQRLLNQKDTLCLKESTPSNSRLLTSTKLPTTSIVEERCVYGRDADKEYLKNRILSNDGSNGDVIAIVGMGGLGKTTLAQLLYNDYEINGAFMPNKVWISVGEDFDAIKITKTILEKLTSQSCESNDFDQLQMKLKETLSAGKRFLIILDDVWNENDKDWDELRKPLNFGAPGSKIIVTTRNKRVASAMRATSPYKLQVLTDEDCWLLFAKYAFTNISSPSSNSKFEVVGRKFVKKCQGLPLAARILGGLLCTKLGYKDWDQILASPIWDLYLELSGDGRDIILPILKLSYHHLPSNLKRCFAFCSIVPKNYNFKREKIVLLWMAENLLQDSKSKKRIDVGYEYLRELELRSLIQPSPIPGELHFTMHDFVNDLAKSISGEFCKRGDTSNIRKKPVGKMTRHYSYVVTRGNYGMTRFEGVNEGRRLRTFLPLLLPECKHFMTSQLDSKVWLQLNVLRSLTLAFAGITTLSDSIGNLKLLRYLDLSDNSKLVQLPESVASLYNLEVLNLSECRSLTKLPTMMRRLTKLNHLNIRHTNLREMPLQMVGSLKDLDVLTNFVLGKGKGSSIGELKELKDLRGDLSISGLQHITDPEDALVANLNEKAYIEEVRLEWNIDHDNSKDARIILENLRPHDSLKKLYISKYSGTRLPDWSGHFSFVKLDDIVLWGLKYCFHLSPLGQLPSLKSLSIYKCDSLVTLIPVELPSEIYHGHFSV